MLNKLTINNIALIDKAEIEFDKGLNVLSGETGSGKSVIIESINFVLGARSDHHLIRSGETECMVIAEFDVSNNPLIKEIYSELDFDYDDTLIISRKLTIDKKNTVKINGNSANVSMVKRFTEALVDVHGQSEHFALLSGDNQLKLLDAFCGEEILKIKNNLSNLYNEYKSVNDRLETLGGDEDKRLIRLDVINYQINEITSANVLEGEEEKLREIKEKLKHEQKILLALSTLKNCISEENGAGDIISFGLNSISSISDLSIDYQDLYNRLESAYSEIEDISDTASNLLDEFDYSEYSEEEINSRLDIIKTIKRKYGDFSEMTIFLQNIIEEKENLENFNEINQKLLIEKEKLQKDLYNLYEKLSNIRKNTANKLNEDIRKELSQLGMNKALFEVKFNDFPSFENCKFNSSNGVDNVEYLFSANVGEPLKPLSLVISGGEISRFMLSVKVVSSKYNNISTFIFDEIDSGISGVIARTVAEKLCLISKNVQVIAISHLPQIISFSDNSLLISKTEVDNKAITQVKKLSREEKINEIVRLIGGTLSEGSLAHSESMLISAEEFKNNI